MSDYPTESELRTIAKWDFQKKPIYDFLHEIERLWHYGSWGFSLKKGRAYHSFFKNQRCLRLILHTGGWSGNESIIQAMEKNFIFWTMTWFRSQRGGHYWFEIRPLLFRDKP